MLVLRRTVRLPAYAGLTLVLAAHAAGAGLTQDRSGATRDALAEWRDEHGEGWEAVLDEASGRVRFLYGASTRSIFTPRDEGEWLELARYWIAQTESLHGVSGQTLVDAAVMRLPSVAPSAAAKWVVTFQQEVAALPVEGSSVGLLFRDSGALVSLESLALPAESIPAIRVQIGATEAAELAATAFDQRAGASPGFVDVPQLVVARAGSVAAPCWRVDTLRPVANALPIGWTFWLDARDGAVVRTESNVHTCDIQGTVTSLATPGDRPDVDNNPPQVAPARHLVVTASQGEAETDDEGGFVLGGAAPPDDLVARYEGPFATVINAAGGNHVITHLALSETGNDIMMNPLGEPLTTAQANAFVWINELRDWIRSVNDQDDVADFQALANVNLPGPCNAFWTSAGGGSVNFFVENLCVNSAYSSVVVHEMGHWLNERYGSGNGADGFGEGNADVYAMYLLDTPIVGRDFSGPGSKIRDGRNLRQFCGDQNPGCWGEVHDDGEVLMGALWKVRERLQSRHGSATGGVIANALFNSWMNVYDDRSIKSIIELHWLVLDDDDGDLTNGTPNYAEIDAAFRTQGFPGFDVDCPAPVPYCSSAPNSEGPGVFLAHSGSTSVASNDLVLLAPGSPPGKFGIFYYGTAEVQVPFGNGFRCIGGEVFRLPVVVIDALGVGTYALDLDSLPAGGDIDAGDVIRFQFWYRDPAGGGAAFNLSDALRIEFCP